MPTREKLEELAEEAVERRMSGIAHNGRDHDYPLHGYCFDNAYVMYNVLNENEIDAKIVMGARDRDMQELQDMGVNTEEIETAKQLSEEFGYVHYWIITDDGWIIDLCSETNNSFGDILISKSIPSGYHLFEDSTSQGLETLRFVQEENARCPYCSSEMGHCAHTGPL